MRAMWLAAQQAHAPDSAFGAELDRRDVVAALLEGSGILGKSALRVMRAPLYGFKHDRVMDGSERIGAFDLQHCSDVPGGGRGEGDFDLDGFARYNDKWNGRRIG